MGLIAEPNSLAHMLFWYVLFPPTLLGGFLLPIGLLHLSGWMTTGGTVENFLGERPEYRSTVHYVVTVGIGFVVMLATGVCFTVLSEGILFSPA